MLITSIIYSVAVAVVTAYGPVVQLVRTLACHARGRRFEPVPGRHFAVIAQAAEHFLGKEEVTSSNLVNSSTLLVSSHKAVFGCPLATHPVFYTE